jgi:hypothetical protein
MSLAAGEVERAPKRFNGEIVASVRITDKYNPTRAFSTTFIPAVVPTTRSQWRGN